MSSEFDGRLTLIDPRTNSVTRTVQLGQRPQGLAVIGGRLFVAVRSGGVTHRGGVLRLVGSAPYFARSVDTLNSGTFAVTISTNDGLVAFRRVGGEGGNQLVPDLAVALPTPTDGGRTLTFRLRSGIRYSSGRLVRPEDFRRALERIFLIYHDTFYYGAILGAHTCVAKPARCDLSHGVVTDDRAQTVVFHLRAPDPDFLYKLALPFAFAVPSTTPARDTGTHPLPATGPYMIGSFTPDRELTLVRNPRFREWSKAAQPAGYPDRITWKLSVGTRAEVRAVENDRADVPYDGIPPELEREVETQYANQVHTNPSRAITYLFLNTRVPPFADVRVRRAVNYAADRAAAGRVSAHGNGARPLARSCPRTFPASGPTAPTPCIPAPVTSGKDPISSAHGGWSPPPAPQGPSSRSGCRTTTEPKGRSWRDSCAASATGRASNGSATAPTTTRRPGPGIHGGASRQVSSRGSPTTRRPRTTSTSCSRAAPSSLRAV